MEMRNNKSLQKHEGQEEEWNKELIEPGGKRDAEEYKGKEYHNNREEEVMREDKLARH